MSPRDAELWVARVYLEGFSPLRDLPPSEIAIDTTNAREIRDAQFEARRLWAVDHDGFRPAGDVRLPPGTSRPKVLLPTVEYAPDIVNAGGLLIVSARLRYAMALPDAAVQFLPINLIDGSDLAYERDYRWMAYLQSLPVLDLAKSEFDMEEPIEDIRPEEASVHEVRRVVVLDDFQPTSPLFRMQRRSEIVLATEALARRVERAGCTGIAFWEVEPALRFGYQVKQRLRQRSHL